MKKNKHTLPLLSAVTAGLIGLTIFANGGKSFNLFAAEGGCDHVGNHYDRKDQTLESSGWKEFWSCCLCHKTFIEEPTVGTFTDRGTSLVSITMSSDNIAYLPQLEEPTQDMFPNTLYTVTGTSSSSTTGSAPTIEFVSTRINYENRATDPSTYACVYDEDGNITKYLKKGLYYTSLDDVANYILAFNEIPANYLEGRSASKSTAYNEHGGEYSRIAPGLYGLTSGGTSSYDGKDAYPYSTLPKSTDGNYYEIDVGYTWQNGSQTTNYAGSTSYNRGPLRLVVYWNGARSEGQELNERCYEDATPVIFFTPDHYSTAYEYSNYVGGWGSILEKNNYANYTPLTTI